MLPRSGDVVHLARAASVQFDGNRAILFRIIRVHNWPTSYGWVWLDGYKLNAVGHAVERRTVFVQIDGLCPLEPRQVPDPRNRNTGRIPRQRYSSLDHKAIRAWANANDIPCNTRGFVSGTVVDAWTEAHPTEQQAVTR